MKKAIALAALICAIASIGTGSPSAASKARKFSPHQEPRGIGNLVAHGDRVTLVYDAGVKSATGFAYVRNDLRRKFVRLALAPEPGRGAASTFRARVPARLIRGHRLRYYAVLRNTKSRRTVRVPARGTSSALILGQPEIVDLGTHRFGETRSPDQVVARAKADQVGWQIPPPGPKAGPQSFLVAPDHSIWLHDSFNDRMLVWSPGDPNTIVRSVPLPDRTADNDVALGPNGSLYVTHGVGHGLDYHIVLKRLSATGGVMWTARLAGDFFGDSQSFMIGTNSALRPGPDGTLHVLVGMFGRPGGEFGWMPVATSRGRAIPMRKQVRRTDWPYQPIGHGQRMVTETYTPKTDGPVQEVRVAIVNRHGNVVRAWRVISRTPINLHDTPRILRGAPTLVLDLLEGQDTSSRWEYEVLRLVPSGTPAMFSVPHMTYGDNVLPDVRLSSTPDGGVYQLSSDPSFGVQILRYAF